MEEGEEVLEWNFKNRKSWGELKQFQRELKESWRELKESEGA